MRQFVDISDLEIANGTKIRAAHMNLCNSMSKESGETTQNTARGEFDWEVEDKHVPVRAAR